MSKRIRELVEQAEEWVCKNYPDAMDDNEEFHTQTMYKLAELLHKDVIASILITDILMEEKGQTPTSEDYIQAISKDSELHDE